MLRSWWWPSGRKEREQGGGQQPAAEQQQQGQGGAQAAAAGTGAEGEPPPPPERRKLKPLTGDGGSILNIFRVLVPGGAGSKGGKPPAEEQPAPASPAYAEAHRFEAEQAQACCRAGVSEEGARLHQFAPGSFDVVVDTFGLCSHANPVKVCGAGRPLPGVG